jgi:transposase
MSKQRQVTNEHEIKELQAAYQQSKDAGTRTRLQAVKLYFQGYAWREVVEITGTNRSCLMDWSRKYRQRGLAGLQDHRGGPVRAKLKAEQLAELKQKLGEYRPRDLFGANCGTSSGAYWTIVDLARAIERWYGVKWKSRSSYQAVLAACEYTFQRTEKVFKSRKDSDVLDFEAELEKK